MKIPKALLQIDGPWLLFIKVLSLSSVTTADVVLREEKKCLSLEASVYHQEMGESRSVEKYTFDAYERVY